ncbi:MAG: hypothetical protein IJW21_00175, partial [Clostridia bacterium]|nr:hypothetical protein [Clostridia bacterium]
LDLWQWICGMPAKISAKMHFGKWHDIEVEDDVSAYVEYENGATGVFITSTGDAPGTNRFEITLEKGKLIAEGDKLTMWKSEISEPEFSKTNTVPFGSMKFTRTEVETDGENPQHTGVINAFAAAVLRGEPLIADGREGINGLLISNAMHLSAWTGKEIDLAAFDHELFASELAARVATSRRKESVREIIAADMSASFGEEEKAVREKRWNTNWESKGRRSALLLCRSASLLQRRSKMPPKFPLLPIHFYLDFPMLICYTESTLTSPFPEDFYEKFRLFRRHDRLLAQRSTERCGA